MPGEQLVWRDEERERDGDGNGGGKEAGGPLEQGKVIDGVKKMGKR